MIVTGSCLSALALWWTAVTCPGSAFYPVHCIFATPQWLVSQSLHLPCRQLQQSTVLAAKAVSRAVFGAGPSLWTFSPTNSQNTYFYLMTRGCQGVVLLEKKQPHWLFLQAYFMIYIYILDEVKDVWTCCSKHERQTPTVTAGDSLVFK